MTDSTTIERDIDIDAPVDVVWRTITEPELIRTWFADVVELDARPGAIGSLTFRADTDDPHTQEITIVDVDRPHRFSYRWVYPLGERATETNSTLVTFTLVALDDTRTRLRIVESGIDEKDMTAEERRRFVDDHTDGWQVQGDRLVALFTSG
jgi:uncharacterized protein YndB with AHSA1/START domain